MSVYRSYLVLISSAILLAIGASYFVPRQVDIADLSPPRILYPHEILLGEYELGSIAIAELKFENPGNSELVIDEIRSSCSCMGLERQVDREFIRMNRIVIPPNSEAPFVIRQSVRGVPVGSQATQVIHFHTNDPEHPYGEIQIRISKVKGGVRANPRSILVENIPVGKALPKKVIEIYDDALQPRKVKQLVSSNPDRIKVQMLPIPLHENKKYPDGFLIARGEVEIDTTVRGSINEFISIHLDVNDLKPDFVPVIGSVLSQIELSPSELTLPRRSSEGSVYEATCICRSTVGSEFRIQIEKVPSGILIELNQDQVEQSIQLFSIKVDPKIKPGKYTIALQARYDKDVLPLTLPISVSDPEVKP